MTPEERANKIITDKNWLDTDWVWDGEDERPVKSVDEIALSTEIAAAIHAAILEERVRCAKVAENLFAGDTERALRADGYNAALAVAAHIRALD